MADILLQSGISFARNIIGIIVRPYETYRRIVKGSLYELLYLTALLATYFATASLIKTNSFRPFFLTRQFVVLASAAGMTYLFVVGLLWALGKLTRTQGTGKSLLLGWGYTLIPTVVWFWGTSILYILLPPPRTQSLQGVLFSVVYLLFCVVLFFWKIILTYLTLRFSLRTDLVKISIISVLAAPVIVIYSWGMYRMGIFRIPFI